MRVRKEIMAFAEAMEYKLRENDHKGGWEESSMIDLKSNLKDEMLELFDALDNGTYYDVLFEAADVGNFAMMIAWNVLHKLTFNGD